LLIKTIIDIWYNNFMTQQVTQHDSGLAIASMVLGILSLAGFGLLLGVPAIVLGAIALKKNMPNRGFSIAGIVTGGISTVVSLLVLMFFAFVFVWAVNSPSDIYPAGPSGDYYMDRHESSRT
jgi:hypothetical protein